MSNLFFVSFQLNVTKLQKSNGKPLLYFSGTNTDILSGITWICAV